MNNRTIADVKRNDTTVILTDELLLPSSPDFDIGFIKALCPHCEAHLYYDEKRGVVTCLNACFLPTWAYREMQQGLEAAAARVQDKTKRPE